MLQGQISILKAFSYNFCLF